MDLLEYKKFLVESVTAGARKAAGQAAQQALSDLSEHLRQMEPTDRFLLAAWQAHGQLTNEAQSQEALRTALGEFRAYDTAEQVATIFLTDLAHAATPQEGFV